MPDDNRPPPGDEAVHERWMLGQMTDAILHSDGTLRGAARDLKQKDDHVAEMWALALTELLGPPVAVAIARHALKFTIGLRAHPRSQDLARTFMPDSRSLEVGSALHALDEILEGWGVDHTGHEPLANSDADDA